MWRPQNPVLDVVPSLSPSKRISYVTFKVLQFSDAPKSTQIIALKYVSFPMFLHYVSCLSANFIPVFMDEYPCYPIFHGEWLVPV